MINHICCVHSDANWSARASFVSLTNWGLCLHARRLPVFHRITWHRITWEICHSDGLVSCANAHQSLDFFELFFKESTPRRPTAWSNKAVLLVFQWVCDSKIHYYSPCELGADTGDTLVCVSSFISMTYKVHGCHQFPFNQRQMSNINQ